MGKAAQGRGQSGIWAKQGNASEKFGQGWGRREPTGAGLGQVWGKTEKGLGKAGHDAGKRDTSGQWKRKEEAWVKQGLSRLG